MGGFGGGFGGFGRGRGRGMGGGFDDRMVGNQGMMSDMQYRGGPDPRMRADIPRQLEGTPQPPENMPQQYSPEEYLKRGLQMQAQNASMNNRGGIEARPQYQDSDMYSHALPSNYRPSAIPNTQLGRMYGNRDMASLLQQLA